VFYTISSPYLLVFGDDRVYAVHGSRLYCRWIRWGI